MTSASVNVWHVCEYTSWHLPCQLLPGACAVAVLSSSLVAAHVLLLVQVSQSLAASLSAADLRSCLAVLLLAGQLLSRGIWPKGRYLTLQQAGSAWQEGHAGDQGTTATALSAPGAERGGTPLMLFHIFCCKGTDGLISVAVLCCLCAAASGLPVLLKALNLLLPAADSTVLQASALGVRVIGQSP